MNELAKYSPQAIANIQTVEEAKDGYEKLKALVSYFRNDYEQAFSFAVGMIECYCKMGELIEEMQENGKLATRGKGKNNGNSVNPESPRIYTLSDLGISEYQSSSSKKSKFLPSEQRQQYYQSMQDKIEVPTIAGILRRANEAAREERQKQAEEDTDEFGHKKYRIVYADPPWKYGNTMPEYSTEQGDHYSLMTINELVELTLGSDKIAIKDIVTDDAVLFLWVTSPILEDAFGIIKAWGFKYKASFVWDKIKHNMGHYNSVRHEFLLVCTRGSCTPDVQKLFDSVQSIERGKHSEKPEEFRGIIETLYTYGNKIELFSRKQTEGWDTFGNEKRSVSEGT